MIDYEEASMEELRFWESTILSMIDKNQDIQRSNPPTSVAWQQASDRLKHLFPAMQRLTFFMKSEEHYGKMRLIEEFIEFHCNDNRALADDLFNSAIAFVETGTSKID